MDPGAIPGTSLIYSNREARRMRLAALSFREADTVFRLDPGLDTPC